MRPFTTVAASAPSDAEIVASRRPAATSARRPPPPGVSPPPPPRLNASGLQNVSHVISRAFARSRVVAEYEHQLLFGDVARSGY